MGKYISTVPFRKLWPTRSFNSPRCCFLVRKLRGPIFFFLIFGNHFVTIFSFAIWLSRRWSCLVIPHLKIKNFVLATVLNFLFNWVLMIFIFIVWIVRFSLKASKAPCLNVYAGNDLLDHTVMVEKIIQRQII